MTHSDNIHDKIIENAFTPSISMGQYFLCNISKINRMINAADIQANDKVT